MIDTAERRRSVIDFGKGQRGTGMPVPSGSVGVEERTHLMNLYPGITPVTDFFFFWRRRTTTGNTGFLGRLIPRPGEKPLTLMKIFSSNVKRRGIPSGLFWKNSSQSLPPNRPER